MMLLEGGVCSENSYKESSHVSGESLMQMSINGGFWLGCWV